MLDRDTFAAELIVNANLRGKSHVLGHKRLEMVDQHFCLNPFGAIRRTPWIETILFGIDGPVGDNGVGMIGARLRAANYG